MLRVGVVGDKDSVLFFRALGFEVAVVVDSDVENNRKIIDKMARDGFGAIFVTENVAENIPETINRYDKALSPSIILIPSNTGSLGIGLQRVRDNVEKAVGINILD